MSGRQRLGADCDVAPFQSASGALFATIPTSTAHDVFRRFSTGLHFPPDWEDAWGAFDDSNDLMGACAIVQTAGTSFRAHVTVVPERRRLQIASELLALVIDRVMERGARTLRGSYQSGALGAHRLVDRLELTSARRTSHDHVEVVILLPSVEVGYPDRAEADRIAKPTLVS